MKSREKILETREAADFIVNGMMSGCIQMSVAAKEAYAELVYQFYEEHRDAVSPAQYETCRSDFEYFLSLLDDAAEGRLRRA